MSSAEPMRLLDGCYSVDPPICPSMINSSQVGSAVNDNIANDNSNIANDNSDRVYNKIECGKTEYGFMGLILIAILVKK